MLIYSWGAKRSVFLLKLVKTLTNFLRFNTWFLRKFQKRLIKEISILFNYKYPIKLKHFSFVRRWYFKSKKRAKRFFSGPPGKRRFFFLKYRKFAQYNYLRFYLLSPTFYYFLSSLLFIFLSNKRIVFSRFVNLGSSSRSIFSSYISERGIFSVNFARLAYNKRSFGKFIRKTIHRRLFKVLRRKRSKRSKALRRQRSKLRRQRSKVTPKRVY